jgi:hypothetical protein
MGKPEDSANIFLAHRKRSGLTSKLVLQQQRIMDVTQQNKQFSTDISATFFFPPVGLVNHGWWIWIKNESGQSNTKICWMGFGPTKRATILGS